MTKTAELKRTLKRLQGDARHYKLSSPLGWSDENMVADVVVSAVTLPLGLGVETYIFPADQEGNVTDWGELPGSIKGSLSHAEALEAAGYTVVDGSGAV